MSRDSKSPRTFVLIAFLLLASSVSGVCQVAASSEAVIAGWIERVSLPDKSLVFEAKLDTGADSSSLNGHDIERFRQGGQSFLRFVLSDDGGKSVKIEAPVVRLVRVKRAGTESDSRAVVRLKVCVGGKIVEGDFTVADRADLSYQVLIGRNVLAGRILVDSGRTRIVSDLCALPR